MTHEVWLTQKARLIDRFGKNNFSPEFSLLVSIECRQLPDSALREIVDALIGNRKPSNPPLIQDFRDARLAFERREFDRDANGARNALDWPAKDGLQKYLTKAFPGCKTINEAIEVRRLQVQIEKAKHPNYDPMKDPKWF